MRVSGHADYTDPYGHGTWVNSDGDDLITISSSKFLGVNDVPLRRRDQSDLIGNVSPSVD